MGANRTRVYPSRLWMQPRHEGSEAGGSYCRFIPIDRGRHGRDNGGDIAPMGCRKAAENLDSAATVAGTSPATGWVDFSVCEIPHPTYASPCQRLCRRSI